MFRASATIACLAAGLGVSCAAGLALALGHNALQPDAAGADLRVATAQATPSTALILAQATDAPPAGIAQPIVLLGPVDVQATRRPVRRPQGGDALVHEPVTNHSGSARVAAPTSDFSYTPLAVAPPLHVLPAQPWVGDRNARRLDKMPNLDSAWKSGVYR